MNVKPFLKWAGGKRSLIPEIEKYVPSNFDSYYEPFLGGGALYFHLQPASAYLNDINDRLIKTYEALRDDPQQIISLLKTMPNNREYYYSVRTDKEIDRKTKTEIAAWLIYLNHTCFNGLYRVNSKNEFNTSFGRYENPLICNEENLLAVSELLKGHTRFSSLDFRSFMSTIHENSFVYCDPPYAPISKTSSFTTYAQTGFLEKDHEDLATLFFALKKRNVPILLSNSSAPLIYDLYKNAQIIEVQCKRSITGDGTKRGPIKELLIK